MENKKETKYKVLKILLALLPTLIFVQNYAWMTANKMVGVAFIALLVFIVFSAWSFTEKNHVFERYFRLTEIGLFLMPLSSLIMTFVIGSQVIDSGGDEFSQAGAAIGTAIGGTLIIALTFVIGITTGIIMHLVANNYEKKAGASGVKQPETFAAKHGTIASVGVLLLLAIILGSIASSNNDKTTPTSGDQTNTAENTTVPEEAIDVSAVNLYSAYSANQLAADSQYKDKLLRVSGVVESIGLDILDKPYLTLRTNDMFGSVECNLNETGAEAATKASKGTTIIVIGRNSGLGIATVGLSDCEIVEE